MTNNALMVTTGKRKKKFAKCHKNDNVIQIIYGDPTNRVMNLAFRNEVITGGCFTFEESKYWYCKRNRIEF